MKVKLCTTKTYKPVDTHVRSYLRANVTICLLNVSVSWYGLKQRQRF